MLGLTRGVRVMRKILLSMTTALALGALAIPTAVLAASNHSSGSKGKFNANIGGTAKVGTTQNFAVNNSARTPSNSQSWNGRQWASNARHHHHRHHDRDFRFVPFAAYDDYAAYDD